MPRHAQLNNVDHAGLKVRTARSAALGDQVMSCPVFAGEFRQAQACYPILFHKPDAGPVQPLALFGLKRGENLFLDGEGWEADYIPAAMRTPPFLIGAGPGADGDARQVHVDLDHPRVSETEGEPVFLDQGGMSDLLRRAVADLETLNAGHRSNPAFSDALDRHGLLEPLTLEMEFADGSAGRLTGLHVIAEDRLAALDGSALGELHAAGWLQPVFMAVASLTHLSALIARRNARLAEGRAA